MGLELTISADGHLVGNDQCNQDLDICPIRLDEEDEFVADYTFLMQPFSENSSPRRRNLLYLNMFATDLFFVEREILPIRCPVCGEEYQVTKQQVEELKRKHNLSHSE